ncbi:MAG: phosphotransferase [Actinobacteria bacterium]|nr:phosphotransferase [Actinomycetota bacterium]MBI3687959.1 phosphotransferase [Actinomycetota bacterium]
MTNTSREATRAAEELAGHLGGAVLGEVLRVSEKSLLAHGQYHGQPVVIKALRTGEEFWRTKFDHEIRLYQAFTEHPPPVRVPELIHTDGQRVLVIEHIPGRVVDNERYPEQALPATVVNTVLDTLTAFTRWSPPAGVLTPVFDYPDRIARYHRAGFFDDTDHAALVDLLADAGPVGQATHGDPLPANLLLTEHGGCVLLDFEFTGLFVPGFDLAMLHTLLADTPGAQDRIEALVDEARIEAPFLLNRVMVLSRELRLHTELSDGELRARRLALLRPQWDTVRRRLHTRHTRR